MAWIGAVVSLAELGIGLSKDAKAKKEAQHLKDTRPKIGLDPNAASNLALAKNDLAMGIGARAEQAYNTLTDKDFSNSLSTILKGGGGVNSVGELYGQKEEGRQRLTLLRENARLNQIRNVLDASTRADERNTILPFQVNQDAPWKDATQAVAANRVANQNQINSSINTLGSSLMSGYQQNQDNNFWNNYFNQPTTGNNVVSPSGGGNGFMRQPPPLDVTMYSPQPASTNINQFQSNNQGYNNWSLNNPSFTGGGNADTEAINFLSNDSGMGGLNGLTWKR